MRSSPTSPSSTQRSSAVPASRSAAGRRRSQLAPGCAPAPATTSTSVPSPSASTSIVHSSAGRSWSGSREAAPSESTVRVQRDLASRRRRASRRAGAPPRRPGRRARRRPRRRRSRSARRSRPPSRSMCSAWSRSIEPRGRWSRTGCRCGRGPGSRGRRRPPRPPARPPAGKSGVTPSSAWIAATPLAQLRRRRRAGPARRVRARVTPLAVESASASLGSRRAHAAAAVGGQDRPRRGRPAGPRPPRFPALTPPREQVLDALVDLCTRRPRAAAAVLGLGPHPDRRGRPRTRGCARRRPRGPTGLLRRAVRGARPRRR